MGFLCVVLGINRLFGYLAIWGMGHSPIKFIFYKMGLHQELPVYKATYDLLLAVFQFTKEFSKEYKYTVGESLKKVSSTQIDIASGTSVRYIKD